MVELLVGLFAGAAFGAVGFAVLASGAYDRGYADAEHERRRWRIEIGERHRGRTRSRTAA